MQASGVRSVFLGLEAEEGDGANVVVEWPSVPCSRGRGLETAVGVWWPM